MRKQQLRFPGRGEDSLLLVFEPPYEFIEADAPSSCMAIPVIGREGGLLLGLPVGYIVPRVLQDASLTDEDNLIGPSKEVACAFLEEDELGAEVSIGLEGTFLAVDFTDECLSMLREYDPVTDPSSNIQPFRDDRPIAIPDMKESVPAVIQWLEIQVDFLFSALERSQRPQRQKPPQSELPKVPRKSPQLSLQASSKPWQLRYSCWFPSKIA